MAPKKRQLPQTPVQAKEATKTVPGPLDALCSYWRSYMQVAGQAEGTYGHIRSAVPAGPSILQERVLGVGVGGRTEG